MPWDLPAGCRDRGYVWGSFIAVCVALAAALVNAAVFVIEGSVLTAALLLFTCLMLAFSVTFYRLTFIGVRHHS